MLEVFHKCFITSIYILSVFFCVSIAIFLCIPLFIKQWLQILYFVILCFVNST